LFDANATAEKADRKKLEEERQRADLTIGVNLVDQALSFPATDPSTEVLKQRGARVKQAVKVLEKVADGDKSSPLVWQAKAWLGRCEYENGDGNKAKGRYLEIIDAARTSATAEARRLARYFRLMVIEEDPADKNKATTIEEAATRWLVDYPRQKNTPEGYGIRYMLARVHIGKADDPKLPPQTKDAELKKARALLLEITQNENEYTERGRKLLLAVLAKSGAFTKKIEELKNFEDCWIRAQYENMQMAEAAQKISNPAEADKARDKGIQTVLAVLERGLSLPDAKGKKFPEIGEARFMQVFYLGNLKRTKDVVKIGEAFVKEDPASSSASKIAERVLIAYSQVIAEGEATLTANEVDDLRKKMTDFNRFVQARWSRDEAGDFARGQMAETLVGQLQKVNDPQQRARVLGDVLKTINGMSPTYGYYVPYQDLLAEISLKAEQEKTPLPDDPALPKLTYRQRAMAALEKVPDVDGADPFVNVHYLNARCLLIGEIFKEKKYEQMDQLATPLLKRLPNLRLSTEDKKNAELHESFQNRLVGLGLYAKYGLADAAFTAGDMAKVSALLDPLIADVLANKDHPIKNNAQLGQALMSMALRSSVQQGKLDQARQVVKALQQFSDAEGAGDGAITVLRQLIAVINKQIEELQQKGDQEKLKKAIDGFGALLDDLTKSAKLTPQFILTLASCYSSMDQHKKAVELLNKVAEPKKDDNEGERLYRGSRLLLVRQLRMSGDLKEASAILESIMGPENAPKDKQGWGARNIDALKEKVSLKIAEERYTEGFNLAYKLTKQLAPKIDVDNALKNHYLECYYDMVYSMYKYGQSLKDEKRKEKAIGDAAKMMEELEKKYPGFGSDVSAKRFQDLLKKEPELKAHYDKLKPVAAAQ